ncbi:MAG TPA: DALR domain-containing protein, partial [Gammaproteobacteria bacterium]|nr:DALR domain-containing protein [Gammaproteobacteria bacterium]
SPGEALEGSEYQRRFSAAMDDDFKSAEALADLFELALELNRAREAGTGEAPRLAATLVHLGARLGILQADPLQYLRGQPVRTTGGLEDAEIEARIQARLDARARKDWAEADRIRDELQAAGIQLEDAAGTTRWRRG